MGEMKTTLGRRAFNGYYRQFVDDIHWDAIGDKNKQQWEDAATEVIKGIGGFYGEPEKPATHEQCPCAECNTKHTCDTCRFMERETMPPDLDHKEPFEVMGCRRYPKPMVVEPGHWCGEWQVEEGIG